MRIPSGMIYVASALPSQRPGRVENCLINPSLKVASTGTDKGGGTLPYWPSYSDISPVARRTYLLWLAGGRDDIGIAIGYIFLFFYGLERRLFLERAVSEMEALTGEVRRLLHIYGSNNSFRSYANKFLDAAALLADAPNAPPPDISPDLKNGYEIPLAVRLHLGRRLAKGERLNADDALLWVMSLPDTYLRTPATRCLEELKMLWRVRFRERHADGLRVSVPRSLLKGRYQAASGTFEVDVPIAGGTIPDISNVSAPLKGLQDLLSACTDELDPYSRLIGKKPGAKGTMEAAVLLPKELIGALAAASPLRAISNRFATLFNTDQVAEIPVTALFDILGMARPQEQKISAALANQIGAWLDRLDVGFEPDRRYGPSCLTPEGRAVIFRAAGGGVVDPDRVEFQSAQTLVEIGALAAMADGSVAAEEHETLQASLRAVPGLSSIETTRLLAYAVVVLRDQPRQQAVMNRVVRLPEVERRRVTQAAISAVMADGQVTKAEVKFIEQLYKALGLPNDEVYSALHRGAASEDPVVVAAEERAPGVPIPPRPAAPASVINLDAARLDRIKRETSEVSRLLANIFVDDEPTRPVAGQAIRAEKSAFDGLDVAHADLLAFVLAVPEVSRPAFDERARTLRLLPEGAFETINEWGFDTFEEAILEGEEVILVVAHLRQHLIQLEAAE